MHKKLKLKLYNLNIETKFILHYNYEILRGTIDF